MFPNGRLVIVAMLASVVAVSCGLGVFAAFRVNHQPFTRLQSADPPLQLVFGSGAPAPAKDVSAAPFGVRFLLNVPVAVPETISVVSIQRQPVAAPDAVVLAAESQPAADSSSSATAETPAPIVAVSADQEAPPQAPQASQQAAKEIEPAVGQETTPDNRNGGAGDVALTSPPDQMPAVAPAVPDANAAPDQNKISVTSRGKSTAKAAAKRRVVRRFRRIQPADAAQSAAQSFALTPAYQAIPDATAQRVVRRRVVVKRHRSANKAAAQAPARNQSAASGPVLATSKR
jgi:hypothetical protein